MNLKNLILAFFCLALFSCGDDGDCVQADWIGTYTGTETCDGVEDTTTVTITAGSNENSISIDGVEVEFSGCKAEGSLDLGALGSVSYDYELDGNTITGSSEGTALGVTSECTFSVTK